MGDGVKDPAVRDPEELLTPDCSPWTKEPIQKDSVVASGYRMAAAQQQSTYLACR